MIAKIIVWDETRSRAIQKMKQVLKDTVIFGVHTNIPYLLEILSHIEFVQGKMTTRFIETYFADPIKPVALTENEKLFCEQAWKQVGNSGTELQITNSEFKDASNIHSPWKSYWRGI